MFSSCQELSCVARRLLDLPRVVELGVRRGVHHLVARLNLSRFFRLRGLPRGWENNYLGGSCGERSGKHLHHLVSERQVDHREGVRPVED